MRARSRVLLTACSLALGAATAIGLALVLHRATGIEWERSMVGWTGPEEGDCLVQTTARRIGCTQRSWMKERLVEARPNEVVYERLGIGHYWLMVARGKQEERPEVSYKADTNMFTIEEAGFPFRCLREKKWEYSGGCDSGMIADEGAICLDDFGFETVPGQPIWGGLAADSVVWALPWMAGFLFIGKLRRTWRRRRGVCVACCYAMAGLAEGARCPECGAAR